MHKIVLHKANEGTEEFCPAPVEQRNCARLPTSRAPFGLLRSMPQLND